MSHYQRTTSPLALLVSLALAGLLAIAGAGFAAPALAATSGATASSTSASAPSSFESTLFGWINRDRVARGLRPLRMDGRLNDLAGSRAANLAAANMLSHQVAGGNIGTTLSAWGMQWYRWGEAIGMTSYPYTTTAAGYLYGMWKHSAEHWALLMSTSFNYVGVGVAYRSSNRTTGTGSGIAAGWPDRFDRVPGPYAARRQNDGLGAKRHNDLVRVEGLGPTASDPYRRSQELRRPLPRGQRDLAADPKRNDGPIDQPRRASARPQLRRTRQVARQPR